MKRRWFAVIGAGLLLSQLVVSAAFGFPAVHEWTTIELVLPTIAGVLFIAGGFSAHVWGVEWYQFVGGAYIFMGIWFGLAVSLPMSGAGLAAEPVLAITGIVGGLAMVFIGMSWIRDSRNFRVSQYEPGPILGSTSRNRT